MTALCGGGASQQKPGFGLTVDISGAALSARFASTASWFSALVSSAIAVTKFVLADYCTKDPPSMPTLTAQDFVDVLQFVDPITKFAAQQKIQQWVGAAMWTDLCMCVSGPQPSAPALPAAPANLPTVNPPSVNPPAPTATCGTNVVSVLLTNGGGSTSTLPPGFTLPAGASSVLITAKNQGSTNANSSVNFKVFFTDSGGVEIPGFTDNRIYPNNGGASYSLPIPSNAVTLQTTVSIFAGSNQSQNIQVNRDVYCGTNTAAVAPACCPPDPQLMAEIQQILGLVTLIQRQAVPFAYVLGPTTGGLSGAGVLNIPALLGVKVVATALPIALGTRGTSPIEHFDLGWLTFGTPDGFPSSYRFEHSPQLLLPARCSAYTELAYCLAPGVVISVTQVLREP